jgi:hypothetical protein
MFPLSTTLGNPRVRTVRLELTLSGFKPDASAVGLGAQEGVTAINLYCSSTITPSTKEETRTLKRLVLSEPGIPIPVTLA